MTPTTRQPPRFVPTLTEKVDPRGDHAAAQADVSVEALVNEVMQQIQPMLVQQLQEESELWLRAALAQHLRRLNARTQSALESLVRQAVADALKTQNQANPDAAPGDI
jgi:hypothetical protein